MRSMKALLAATALGLIAAAAQAAEQRFFFTNPSFGGNPLNSAHLLGVAGAQNYYTAPRSATTTSTTTTSATQQFANQITASLLSQVAVQIGNQILGENARDSGTFSVGATTINFARVGGQVNIQINDATSGGSTSISIPVPSF